MLRAIGGVVLGYVVMFVVVFVALTCAYLAMGTDRAFQPGSYEVTNLWLSVHMPIALIAALAGGFVCASVARSGQATLWLAGLVLVLGLAMAVPVMMGSGPEPQPRTAEVGNFQAMAQARQPVWVAVATPLLGAAGVLLGGRLRGRRAIQ